MVMDKKDGEIRRGDGLPGPASLNLQGANVKIVVNGEEMPVTPVTPELLAVIKLLKERSKSAAAATCMGIASPVIRAGLKFLAVAMLATGVGVGLGDGDLFDDVGPTVAQQPSGATHDANAVYARQPGGKTPGAAGGTGSGSDSGGPDGQPGCESRAQMCIFRQPDGRCQATQQPCRHSEFTIADLRLPIEQIGNRTETVLLELREQRNDLMGLIRGQKRLLAMAAAEPRPGKPAVEPISDNEARRLFALVTALELETNFRKAPVILVFALYCRDGKTRKVVARECKCSPALISLRLQMIENKLGRKASELRQIAGHFDQIADSLTDSRARRIDRRRAMESDPDWPTDSDDEV